MINEKNFFSKNKTINVSNTTSLVNLKAELFKKKQDALKNRSSSVDKNDEFERINSTKNVSKSKWNQKAVQLDQKIRDSIRSKRDNKRLDKREAEEDHNELVERELKRSKENLERKSKLYEEKLRNAYDSLANRDLDEEEQNEEQDEDLIDFERKVIDASKEGLRIFDNSQTKSSANDDQMVEYVDSFGRTKMCKRKDLSKIEKLNEQELLRRNLDRDLSKVDESNDKSNSYSDLYSNFVKSKTDSEQINQESEEQSKESHYQNVSKDERREHGTSYYQFSLNEERRKQQIEELNKLRDQTVVERKKADEIVEKRNRAMKERLIRLAKRKGLLVDDDEEELSDNEIEEKINLKRYIKTAPRDEDEKLELIDYSIDVKDREIREWDKDKLIETPFYIVDKTGSDSDNFTDKKDHEDERNLEFAPPDFNSSKNKKFKTEQSIEDKVDEFLKFTINKI